MNADEDSNALAELTALATNKSVGSVGSVSGVDNIEGVGLCEDNKGGCEHICDDTNGRVSCLCYRGYILGDDGVSCIGK